MTHPLADIDAEAALMRYPIAVYGTLRPGYGNDRLWQERGRGVHDGDATVEGYALAGRAFPYATPSPDDTIVVCLIEPEADHYAAVLQDMDWLEGVPHHYTRELVAVNTPDGYRVAWMYVAANGVRGVTPVRRNPAGHFDWSLGCEPVVTRDTHRWARSGPDAEDVYCVHCGVEATERGAARPCGSEL